MLKRVIWIWLIGGISLFAQGESSSYSRPLSQSTAVPPIASEAPSSLSKEVSQDSPSNRSEFVELLESNQKNFNELGGDSKAGASSKGGADGTSAQMNLGAIASMAGGRGRQLPGYRITYSPAQETQTPFGSGNGASLSFIQQQVNAGFPIYMDESERILAIFSVRHTWFDTEAILPDSRRAFPDTLTIPTIGLFYSHRFENGYSSGLIINVNSPSDKPFNSLREVNPVLIGFLRIPVVNQRDAWNLSVFYSPASQLRFPLPGVAYSWNPSPDFRWDIGIPSNLFWRFAPDWTYEFNFLPLTNIMSRTTYKPIDELSLYGSFEWLNEAYLLSGRENRNDRFFFDEKRLELGAIVRPYGNWSVIAAVGYAFDRRFFQGRRFRENDYDRINLASGAYGTLQIGYNFGGARRPDRPQ